MAKTVLGLFDHLGAAQAALRELAGSGIAEQDIGFMADQQHEIPSSALLNESEGASSDIEIVVTVATDRESTTELARSILRRHGAMDLDERDVEWKKQGWKGRFETEGYGGPERRVNNTPWLGPERRKAG
ncbi:MAG: hypothetical protein ACJ8G4_11890 [Burkholderiales bacterium]